MSSYEGCTLILESEYQEAIERAHKKASELFGYVSPIDTIGGCRWRTFVIAPNRTDNVEKKATQLFIEWCETENEQAQDLILQVVQVKF